MSESDDRSPLQKSSSNVSFPLEQGEMLRLILENFPARIFWKDVNSNYLGANLKFIQDAGLKDTNDVVGKTDYDLAWKKEEADFFVDTDKRVMSKGVPEIGIIEPQLRADGKKSWLETNKVPLTNPDGEVIGIMGTYSDITDRVHAQESLKRYTNDLESKNSELEQFAFIAAHDLQEPLRTTLSAIELLQHESEKNMTPDSQVLIDHVKESTLRMLGLVSGVLEFTTMGRNMNIESVDAHSICQNAITDLNTAITNSRAEVRINGLLPAVYAGKVELGIVFQNLISNAIKFRKADTAPEIHISALEVNDHWQFEVKDNGIGIDPVYGDKIFKIFQRLHNRSEFDGNGVGLANCQKIIEMMGGRIWFESEIQQGSTFCFTLKKRENYEKEA